jgi:hypothetical protein
LFFRGLGVFHIRPANATLMEGFGTKSEAGGTPPKLSPPAVVKSGNEYV